MKKEWLKFLKLGDFFYLRGKRYVVDHHENMWTPKIRCVTSSGKYVHLNGMQQVKCFI